MDIRNATNTTIISFKNNQEFEQFIIDNHYHCLGQLTAMWYKNACSFINYNTKVSTFNDKPTIFNIACYSYNSKVMVVHKRLKIYKSDNGGFYARCRFGNAWLNSFFEPINHNGDLRRKITVTELLAKHTGVPNQHYLQTYIKSKQDEKNHFDMIKTFIYYNNEMILILNNKGEKWIFSDTVESKDERGGYITNNVPFKNHSHYMYIDYSLGKPKYIGFAWYNQYESYINEFNSFEECASWLTDVN